MISTLAYFFNYYCQTLISGWETGHYFSNISSFPKILSLKSFSNSSGNSCFKFILLYMTLCETCPNTEFFLVRIFPHSDRYFVSLRIQSKCGKIRTIKNSVFGHFSCRHQNSFYLLQIGPVLEHSKVPKYYEQKCT